MSNVFYDGFNQLAQMGFFDIIIPFILVFAIVFGVLQNVKIFGENSKKFNGIIAFSLGMIVIGQHVLVPGSQFDIVPMINGALPQVALILIAIICLLLISGLFGKSLIFGENKATGWVLAAAIGVIAWIFLAASGVVTSWTLPYWFGPQLWAPLIAIVTCLVVIMVITSDEKKEKTPTFFDELSKLIKK